MSSDIDDSPGTPGFSRAGYLPPETTVNHGGQADTPHDVARLLSPPDWADHDDLLLQLAEQNARAAALLFQIQTAFTSGTVPVVQSGKGESTT